MANSIGRCGESERSSRSTVSVVVPCYNEAKRIGPFLDCLLSQDLGGLDWEIIVADGISRDGTRLVWRANHPSEPDAVVRYRRQLAENVISPMKMEIFVAGADGRNARQVSSFGCASFAPTFTPDGKQILFASNKHNCDSRQFELYRSVLKSLKSASDEKSDETREKQG